MAVKALEGSCSAANEQRDTTSDPLLITAPVERQILGFQPSSGAKQLKTEQILDKHSSDAEKQHSG